LGDITHRFLVFFCVFPFFFFWFNLQFYFSILEAFCLNQRQIEKAVDAMRAFIFQMALKYNANFHELEEITQRALGNVDSPKEVPVR
jgi:hypothetical protein